MEHQNQTFVAGQGPATKAPTIPTDTFEADGVEYKFTTASFFLSGELITADEALQSEKILATLVSVKSGVIEVVPKTKGGE